MSFRHVDELNVVRDEFDAIRASAIYVREGWSSIGSGLAPTKLYDLVAATGRLEATYIVRLTAGYEAIVHDVLRSSPSRTDDKASGVELTNRLSGWLQDLAKASSSRAPQIRAIRSRSAEVRRLLQYRNRLAHRTPPVIEEFSFGSARACLNLMLDLIP